MSITRPHWPLIWSLLISSPLTVAAQSGASSTQVTKAPELLKFVEAPYPEAELAQAHDVSVVLSLVIDAEGKVEEATVVSSGGPAFDQAALEAARAFVFKPAEIGGAPHRVKINYRYQFVSPPPPSPQGRISGRVQQGAGNRPLAGARVSLLEAGQELAFTVTDADGSFSFEGLTEGSYRLKLSSEGQKPLESALELKKNEAKEVALVLEEEQVEPSDPEDDYEVVVRAPPRLVQQVVSVTVAADDARRLPGTVGDVLKVVDSMPGVARASAGSGDVVVWGASPTDTRTYIGGVRVPALYHFGGLRSVLHGDLVESVELIPGGYGAAHGRGLGGLILVGTRAPAESGVHGSVQADVLDASAAVSAQLVGSLSVQASARKSYVAELGGLVTGDSFGQYFTLPSYQDGALRLRYQLSSGEFLEVGGMFSGDSQKRNQPSSNPELRVSEERRLDFGRVDLRYEKTSADGSVLSLQPWYGRDWQRRSSSYGGAEQWLESSADLFGLRVEHKSQIHELVSARFGLDFEATSTQSSRVGSLTTPAREGDRYVFGRAPADQLLSDKWQSLIVTAAPFAEADLALFNRKLHVLPGVRFEPYLMRVNRARPQQDNSPDQAALSADISVEPRATVRWEATDALSFNLGSGLYRQPPLADDLSAVFGNPLLKPARGAHLLGGFRYRLPWQLGVEATGFYTRGWDTVSRNPAQNPQIAEVLVQEGESRTYGAQFLLRRERKDSPFFGWIAYTILRAEKRNAGASDYRLSDLDQTHVLTALASYALGAGFEVGLRARFATGYPRTPVVGAYYDAKRGLYEPVLGEQNSIRIPSFFQLDARVSKTFVFATSKLEVYLDLQNASNRENPEEIAYSADFSSQRYIRGMPILPVLGARFEF